MILNRTKVKFTGNPIKSDKMIKHVGAYIPLRVFSNITIYTLAKNWNKSNMVSTILDQWLLSNFTSDIEKECIQIVASNIYNYFKELKSTHKSTMSYEQFIQMSIKELEYKGIIAITIKSILKEIDFLHEINNHGKTK